MTKAKKLLDLCEDSFSDQVKWDHYFSQSNQNEDVPTEDELKKKYDRYVDSRKGEHPGMTSKMGPIMSYEEWKKDYLAKAHPKK